MGRQLMVIMPQGELIKSSENLEDLIYQSAGIQVRTESDRRTLRTIRTTLNTAKFLLTAIPTGPFLRPLLNRITQLLATGLHEQERLQVIQVLRHWEGIEAFLKLSIKRQGYSRHVFTNMLVVDEGEPVPEHLRTVEGGFQTGVVYAAHPLKQELYIRLSEYHAYLAGEKRAEFLRIVSSLGARSVKLIEQRVRTGSAQLQGGVVTPLEGAPLNIGARGSGDNQSTEKFQAVQEFEELPQDQIGLPPDLLWYKVEPLWQAMAESRLAGRITRTRMSLDFNNDFGVDAEMAMKIQQFGFSAGGRFKQTDVTSQEYEIEFVGVPTAPTMLRLSVVDAPTPLAAGRDVAELPGQTVVQLAGAVEAPQLAPAPIREAELVVAEPVNVSLRKPG